MATKYPTGTRLRCERCGSEIIVLNSHEPVLDCCDQPMQPTFVPESGTATADPGHADR